MAEQAHAGGSGEQAEPEAIVLEGVNFAYGEFPVLEDVDLRIAAGDFACIIGPNGGGKTTLLRIILGLVKPQTGIVRVLGTTPREARSRIGYMPQHLLFDPKFPVSVNDVVLMGCLGRDRAAGPYTKACRYSALEALDRVGIADLADRPYAALSGGQRQRTLIARALASGPAMLLFDEPTSNLDVQMERELYELLSRLNEHLTVVTVTHDLGFVSQYVRTVVCVKGRVAIHQTKSLSGADLAEIYGEGFCAVRHNYRPPEGG